MTVPVKSPKKLIEVALPLDAINEAAAREKSIRHGHPSTLHLWWARRPLAAARAVIFAQMVNDPGYQQGGGFRYGVNKEKARKERERLFDIIKDLVKWENTNNEEVLERARAEIRRSWRETCELNKDHPDAARLFNPDKLPAFHDPFAGGGAIPLEAQRLGLESYASDLNPVAVTINKAMIEIPPRFAGRSPVGPLSAEEADGVLVKDGNWKGAQGLAEDVRHYGAWMREEAQKRIGHLYPQVEVTEAMAEERPDLKEYVGKKLTVIAWLWARTVKSPNPAYSDIEVPLVSTFVLSSKAGKEAYVEPVIEGRGYRFTVKKGVPPASAKNGTKLARGANFKCLLSNMPIDSDYIKDEGINGRMNSRLLAIVAEGHRGRIYLSPIDEHAIIAQSAVATWKPETPLPDDPRNFWTVAYGLKTYGDLFTPRQLVALTTFSDLVGEAIEKCRRDAVAAGCSDDDQSLESGGQGATAYAQAVGVYLALAVDYAANYWSEIATPAEGFIRGTFSRQALPMTWDFAEAPPFGTTSGCWDNGVEWVQNALSVMPCNSDGAALQSDAANQTISNEKVVSTDPPYYDNIGYADLSDYFYIWLRKNLKQIFPDLFTTITVPKAEELVATPYRHGGKDAAEAFFLKGMTCAFRGLAERATPAFPITIYYAFKQAESESELGTSSTGWETFLDATIRAGFSVVGTWPMRTERSARSISIGTNALASSIVLVCRKRSLDAKTVGRREFLRDLNAQLPEALEEMTRGGEHSPVAPVDLSQAVIGPGMAIFSQYSAVLEADGTPMSVRTALQLINRFITENDFDADTRFCLDWFEQHHWDAGKFGEADVLARAKGTSVDGLREAGVIRSAAGQVRLLRPTELPADWEPATDTRLPVWEGLHHLIRALQTGESDAGRLLAGMPNLATPITSLAYRLYTLCERQGLAEDARSYNELVTSWSGIEQVAQNIGYSDKPRTLF